MRQALLRLWVVFIVFALGGCSSLSPATLTPLPTSAPSPTQNADIATAVADSTPTPLRQPSPTVAPSPTTESKVAGSDPFSLISQESMLSYIEDLTAIQPYSGWRNSASEGEAEALDYVARTLDGFGYLQSLGLEVESQAFRVFLGTELWETRLYVDIDGQEKKVPASGLRGPRDDIAQALRFDSDGSLNDRDRNPVVVEGPVLAVRSEDEIDALSPADLRDRLVFLDYEAIDRITQGNTEKAVEIAWNLLAKEPAGLVLVTTFSNEPGESHGTYAGDLSALNWVETEAAPPTLYVRLEDMASAGIHDWDDLARIESARLTWDADVFSPATSSNLVARIPGADPSVAVILGAHIDSPNAPGALDDGSGSALLLEVARVLNEAQIQPPSDLYLAWFGSEEIGLYGSSHFVATHQELLDRTLAMLQIDSLAHPLDGINAELSLVTWSYGRFGDERLAWPDYLIDAAAEHGVTMGAENHYYIYSDNSGFGGFDVPHADLIYTNYQAMQDAGGIHYASHMHDPYDTVDLAGKVADVLEEMVVVALTAALEPPWDISGARVTPRPDRRALFVASHTEPAHMTPVALTDLGMALSWEGFDVDLVPYGQPVTGGDLEGADLVVVLPVVDYPSPEGDANIYDESWSEKEIATLESYVDAGGLLVLTNSAHRLKYGNQPLDSNEDWLDMNAVAERFGVRYSDKVASTTVAYTAGENPLIQGIGVLEMVTANGLPFSLEGVAESDVLAQVDGKPSAALVDHGQNGGQVLVLADLGILGATWGPPANLTFWQNLARYARN